MGRPTPLEVDQWYEREILPLRTAAAGFSPGRIWRGPVGVMTGNKDDANGLCGDVSTFVVHKYQDAFKVPFTTEGTELGVILWSGTVFNHIANVMVPRAKNRRQRFVTVGSATVNLSGDTAWKRYQQRPGIQPAETILGPELLKLRVYDLYYKMKPTTVAEWWRHLDGGMNGTVDVGPENDFAE